MIARAIPLNLFSIRLKGDFIPRPLDLISNELLPAHRLTAVGNKP